MELLLDTQVLLWIATAPDRLSRSASEAVRSPANSCSISVISPWELTIKKAIGKLDLAQPIEEVTSEILQGLGAKLLDINMEHVLTLGSLSLFHRDPFDQMLIAQAQAEGLTIVTSDNMVRQYDVPTLW